MKQIVKCVGTVITGLIMFVALFILVTFCFGWRIDTVLSGSMYPTLKTGEVVVTQPVDPETVERGDIITFRSPLDGKLVCHRVVEVQENSPLFFQTKGDANEEADSYLVPAQNVVSELRFHTPLLVYAGAFIRSPLGFILLMVVPGLILIGMEMKNISNIIAEEGLRSRGVNNVSNVIAGGELRREAEWGMGLRREDWLAA